VVAASPSSDTGVSTNDLAAARRFAAGLVASQFGLTALIAGAMLIIYGQREAIGALAGGGISAAANLVQAVFFFRHGPGADPKRILRNMYAGESAKFGVTVLLLIVVLSSTKVAAGPFFAAYVAGVVVYWFALLKRGPGAAGTGSTQR
jgi:F0F1-type ATP synthase assembly protein I